MSSIPAPDTLDVIVVGAGFSGLYALHRFKQLGYKIQGFEAGSGVGGVWYWNRYPGARVDSEYPFYQLNQPKVWRDFNFTERFPNHKEIRSYLNHAADTLDVRKNIIFDAAVNSAKWDEVSKKWTITTSAGHTASARYLLLCTGLLYKMNKPDFPGIDKFEGEVHHSAFWTEDEDLAGKKVCVIGAGATGVQIVSTLAKTAAQLTSLVRRPSYCFPMRNRNITVEEQNSWKIMYSDMMNSARKISPTGFFNAPAKESIWSVNEEERESYFEELWRGGGFGYGTCNYPEVLVDEKANRIAYDFWARKVRERITDPKKRDILAPLEPVYPFGTKRNPLEHDYYDVVNNDNVDIVDLKATPIKEFTEKGITFEDGTSREFDHVVLATGFESFSGSLAHMGLESKDGRDIKDIWAENGIASYLGLAIHGFPNLFMCYSPQAPTAFSNGPTILECQVDYVVDAIKQLKSQGVSRIEPTKTAQEGWCQMITSMAELTLLPRTESWWTASNIKSRHGKPQMLTYVAGIPDYERQIRETLDGEWRGYDVVKGSEVDAEVVQGNGVGVTSTVTV